MADAESVTIGSLKHELASSPRLGVNRIHQARAGAEALEDLVDIGDVDEDPLRLGWLVNHVEKQLEAIFAQRCPRPVDEVDPEAQDVSEPGH